MTNKLPNLTHSDLAACCREILEWRETGLLAGGSGGVLRTYASSFDLPLSFADKLSIAENRVAAAAAAMMFVIEGAK